MNLKELYEIIEKFDKPVLWEGDKPSQFDIHASQFGVSPETFIPLNESVLARRKIVLMALSQVEEIIERGSLTEKTAGINIDRNSIIGAKHEE